MSAVGAEVSPSAAEDVARGRKTVARLLLALLVADTVLFLWTGKRAAPEIGVLDFLSRTVEEITGWTGRLVWVLALVYAVAIGFYRGRLPQRLKPDQVSAALLRLSQALFVNRAASSVALTLAAVLLVVLAYRLTEDVRALPAGGQVFSSIDLGPSGKRIYVANDAAGQVRVHDADFFERSADYISISGRPVSVAMAPDNGPNGELYIVDAASNQLLVMDRKTHQKLAAIAVGILPLSVVVTPGQLKAYVNNQQPAPQGTISVIDLHKRKVVNTITGVNCPQGIALSPNGRRLYVASQCGGDKDPLFVVDTHSDKVVASVQNLAVGSGVAVTPDGSKVYVVRAAYTAPGGARSPAQISVVTTADYKVAKSIKLAAHSIAVTADGKHVLALSPRCINLIDARSDAVINSIQLQNDPASVAVTKDDRVFTWIPAEKRLFLVGLSGLLQSGTACKQ